jgi:hypothetical protein
MRSNHELENLAKAAGLSRVRAVFQGDRGSRVIHGCEAANELREIVLEDESAMTDEQVKSVVRKVIGV